MASGHVNRANRPNTWLLRPMLRREDSSCQPGAVHTWPLADIVPSPGEVLFRLQSGRRGSWLVLPPDHVGQPRHSDVAALRSIGLSKGFTILV